jgi:hypothetical protein
VKTGIDKHDTHKLVSLQIICFAALLAFYFNPDKTLASGRSNNPGVVSPGGVVAYMALVATPEHRNPVANFILVKTDYFLLDYIGIHSATLRALAVGVKLTQQTHYTNFSH